MKGKSIISLSSVSDRVVQYIWGLVLEPVFNSLFFENQMPFSCLSKCVFVKYGLILKLINQLQVNVKMAIGFNWNIFSCFRLIFTPNYLLKILFVPSDYRQAMLDSFRCNSLIYKRDSNQNLQHYLHNFHFFVIFLGFSLIKKEFLERFYSKVGLFFPQIDLISSYLEHMVFILNKNQDYNYFSKYIPEFLFGNKIWNTLLRVNYKLFGSNVNFLDWNIKRLQLYKITIFPNYKIWKDYKKRFKQILNFNKYNIYQRLKFLEISVQTRFYSNWFCSSKTLKKEFYSLKISLNNNLKMSRSLFKYEKTYFLSRIFNTSFF